MSENPTLFSKSRTRALKVIALSPTLAAICGTFVAAGRYYDVSSVGRSLALVLLGILAAKMLLVHYQGNGALKLAGTLAFVFGVAGPLIATSQHAVRLSFWSHLTSVLYSCACLWGTAFLIFALFRRPFSRFLEAADDSGTSAPI